MLHTRVFDILDERGVKLVWLARRIGVTASYLSQVKHGQCPINAKFIAGSVRALGMPMDELFYVDSNREAA